MGSGLSPHSNLKARLDALNPYITAIFTVEMVLKVVAYGFAFTPRAYLKDGWNILDFTIVIAALLVLLAEIVPAFGRFKPLRILRVLRPLRLLQRSPGMRIIITAIVKTIPAVVEVCAIVFAFHVVFSIVGMMLCGLGISKLVTRQAPQPPLRGLAHRRPKGAALYSLNPQTHHHRFAC